MSCNPDAGEAARLVDITISLVSHDQRHDLEKLLPTLLPAAALAGAEILLVDNRSKDGTAGFVRRNFPSVNILTNSSVAGYGENHNLNLGRARGRYFVIMNSDMTVQPDSLGLLRDFMNEHPEIGILSPKVLNADGTIQGLNKRYPALLDLFLRRFVPKAMQPLFRKRLDYYEMRDIGYGNTCEVPFLSGAFMFCRLDMLRSLGGFDPRYFLYFEDADLCRRAQRTHKTVYCPEVSVTHFWHRSARTKGFYAYHFFRSALLYYRRWGYKIY